ncbi:M-phase-specific PLK1-interacting protein [Pempheris klunzingeri]|uniref:M-phase-specific PLK1-interacting protein n=1 Tax=Pempheris klunzingeri TaxID=3127111 RepID=UPI00398020EA
MYRAPVRPQRGPGTPRPTGRFQSPRSCWGLPGPTSTYGGSRHRGRSPWDCPAHSPGSPVYSPGSNRGSRDGSPAGYGSRSRGFGEQMWRRGGGFRWPRSFSPAPAHNLQPDVQKYFSPSMLQDPWAALQPVTAAAAAASRQTT